MRRKRTASTGSISVTFWSQLESTAVTCILCGVGAGSAEMTWKRCGDALITDSDGEDDTYNLTQITLINKTAEQIYLIWACAKLITHTQKYNMEHWGEGFSLPKIKMASACTQSKIVATQVLHFHSVIYTIKKNTSILAIWNNSNYQQTIHNETLHLYTHLCLMLRVYFLLREQIQAGCHDDAKSLVRSVWKDVTEMNQQQTCKEHDNTGLFL